MKLLSATPSPYARKVRFALAEKRLAFELVTEVPWDRDATAPRYNPPGKLPLLILDDDSAVFESHYILEWLEAQYLELPLVPRDARKSQLCSWTVPICLDHRCREVCLTTQITTRPGKVSCPQAWVRQRHSGCTTQV